MVQQNNDITNVSQKAVQQVPRPFGAIRLAKLFTRYLVTRIRRQPYALYIEVTNQCNARCGHCGCWKLEGGEHLKDYRDVVRRFTPPIVWLTGGEPLLRRDICDIISGIKQEVSYTYVGISTNGWMLNRDMGERLKSSGLDQLNISIDFLNANHDRHRKLDGLFEHIRRTVPILKSCGLRVVLTTPVMRENLEDLLPIAEIAREWGVEVGYSCYSSLKTGDKNNVVSGDEIERLEQVIDSLIRFKHEYGIISSSDYYLKRIPVFFKEGAIGECGARTAWLYLTPNGYLKTCPDKGIYSHYTEYVQGEKINCGDCWYTCRGETEVPLVERLKWVYSNVLRAN